MIAAPRHLHPDYLGQGFGIIDRLDHRVADDPVAKAGSQTGRFDVHMMRHLLARTQIGSLILVYRRLDPGPLLGFRRKMQNGAAVQRTRSCQ